MQTSSLSPNPGSRSFPIYLSDIWGAGRSQMCIRDSITANKRLITLTQAIREAALQGDDNNCRMLKQQTLPYVTPCGVFTRRRSDCLKLPSGLMVVDVDHLDSPDEAGRLKQLLFKDPYLAPVLVFISPTGRGRCV